MYISLWTLCVRPMGRGNFFPGLLLPCPNERVLVIHSDSGDSFPPIWETTENKTMHASFFVASARLLTQWRRPRRQSNNGSRIRRLASNIGCLTSARYFNFGKELGGRHRQGCALAVSRTSLSLQGAGPDFFDSFAKFRWTILQPFHR